MNVDLQKLVFHRALRVSTLEFERDPGSFKATYQQEMREALAQHIVHAKASTHIDKDFVEAKIDLYVATPDEFWSVVNYKAEQIAGRYGRTVESFETVHTKRIVELYRALVELVSAIDKGEGVTGAHEAAKRALNGK